MRAWCAAPWSRWRRITRDDLVPVPPAALHARRPCRRRGRQPAGGGDDCRRCPRRLGSWAPGAASPARRVPDADVATGRRLVDIPMPDKSQSDVAYGFVGIRRSDPGYMAASVMNNALGQYALGGRLGDSIRERQGMAYYVFSSLDAGLGPGAVMVRAGVSAENVARTIASIDQEIALVLGEGFTEKEIAESRQYLVGSLPRQLETNGGIASFLLNAEFYGLGLDYDRRLPDLIRGVTRDAADGGRAPAARSRPRDGGRRRPRGRAVVSRRRPRQGRLLRRRLHADLPRTHVSGRGLSARLPGARHRRRSAALRGRGEGLVVHPGRGRGAALRRRAVHPLHRVDHRAHGRPRSRRW